MTCCRCAKCRRREIRDATGMTLNLAWNKVLKSPCYLEKVAKDVEREKIKKSISQEAPAIRKAS